MKKSLLIGILAAGIVSICGAGDFKAKNGKTYKDYALVGLSNDLKNIKVQHFEGDDIVTTIVKPSDFPEDLQERVQGMLKNPDMQAAAKRNKAREEARKKERKAQIDKEKKLKKKTKAWNAKFQKEKAAADKAALTRAAKAPAAKFSTSLGSSDSSK